MISKLISWAPTREEARNLLSESACQYKILGCLHNLSFVRALLNHPNFLGAKYHTNWIAENIENVTKPHEFLNSLLADQNNIRSWAENIEWNGLETVSFEANGEVGQVCAVPTGFFVQLGAESELVLHPDVQSLKTLTAQTQGKTVSAPMAGKILQVLCKSGQIVEEGQLLFVLESMKIQMEVRSPGKFSVKDLLVTEGQILTGADDLCTFS